MSAMPLTGLFLGAGASYEAGMPLVWELTTELKNWLTPTKLRELNSGWRKVGNGHSDELIEDVASALIIPSMHYEAILGYVETQSRRLPHLRQEYNGLYSLLMEIIYHILYVRHLKNRPFFDIFFPAYDGLLSLTNTNTPLWMFSLNHDLIIEAIASRLSIPVYTGFGASRVTLPRRNEFGQKIGEIQAEILAKQDLEKERMYFPNPPRPGIYLLKIHGALDEFAFNDGLELLKLIPSAPEQESIFEVLRAANEELLYPTSRAPGQRVWTVNEIAYSDETGVMQFLRRSILAGAFKFPKTKLSQFRQNLNFVSRLVCIGYSFGDLHINVVIREWLEAFQNRRLEIVSPTAEVPSSLLHLTPQIIVTKSTATEYLDDQAGISRSPQEMLQKRLAMIARSWNRDRFKAALESFVKQERNVMSEAFRSNLGSFAKKIGLQDDVSGQNQIQIARQWHAETRISDEEFLSRLLNYLELLGKEKDA